VYQLGRGSEPMIEVGSIIPADALYMIAPSVALADRGNRAHFYGTL